MQILLTEKADNEQSLELRWIPGQSGIKVYIWEGKNLVQSSWHPTPILTDALISAYTEYGNRIENER